MKKTELKKLIKKSVESRDLDMWNADRVDYMKILTDVESNNDDLCFDLISDADGHPISIQAFTTVRHKDIFYHVIVSFNVQVNNNIQYLTDEIRDRYNKAREIQRLFNSYNYSKDAKDHN